MPLIYQKRIFRDDLQVNKNVIYVFGDNEKRIGNGGQAKEMRGEPNAIGVRTKKSPGRDEKDYWTDVELDSNKSLITEDFFLIRLALEQEFIVVLPLDGLGTGLSELPKRAPLTLDFIESEIEKLEENYGITGPVNK